MFVESDAVPETGEAIGKLCPKDEASADRKSGVDRPEGADMSATTLPPARRVSIRLA